MKNHFVLFGAAFDRAVINKRTSRLLALLSGVLASLPYFFENFFIFTFLSLILQFYIAIKQKNENNRIFAPFFYYFLGFYFPLYLFLSEIYPYERFGFSKPQAVLVLICSCIAIPLLHAVVESTLMLISHVSCGKGWDIICYASLWVIGEWILTLGKLAFPWGSTAVSITGFLPYKQTASLLGK